MSSSNQKQLFEDLHLNYQDHYFDAYSNLYRDELIYNKIALHIIKAKRVLEVGCGGGHNFLDFVKLGMSADTYHAIDISSKAAAEFNNRTNVFYNAGVDYEDSGVYMLSNVSKLSWPGRPKEVAQGVAPLIVPFILLQIIEK